MPINVGDAVLTFMGDTTQLDQSFDSVNAGAASKLGPATAAAQGLGTAVNDAGTKSTEAADLIQAAWARVAQATVANQQAQVNLKTATDAASKSGSDDVVVMLALAQAQQQAAAAAIELAAAQKAAAAASQEEEISIRELNASQAVFGEATGITIPRHLRSLVSSLPGVQTALKAAFAIGAVLIFIEIFDKVADKIEELVDHLEVLREANDKLGADYAQVSEGIQREIDDQAAKLISLTKGPVAGLQYAIEHLGPQASSTFRSISGEISNTQQTFDLLSNKWNPFNLFKAAKKDIGEFGATLEETLATAQQDFPGDTTKQLQAGIDATTDKVNELDRAIKQLQTDELGEALGGKITTGLGGNAAGLQAELKGVQTFLAQLKAAQTAYTTWKQAQDAQEAQDAAAHALELGKAEIEGDKSIDEQRAAVQLSFMQQLYSRGLASYDEVLQAQKTYEDQRYQDEVEAQKKTLALLEADPVHNGAAIISANKKLEEIEIEHTANNLKISQDGYNHDVEQGKKYFEQLIAATKQGTDERTAVETQYAEYLKTVLGSESDAYLSQLAKVSEARRAAANLQKQLIVETAAADTKAIAAEASGQVALMQYLVSTSRATAAQLLTLQHASEEQQFESQKTLLLRQVNELDPSQILERKKLLDELDLLELQHYNKEQLWALQSADTQETYFKQLGLTSDQTMANTVAISRQSYQAIANSGTASYADILRAREKLITAEIAQAIADGDKKSVQQLTAELAKLELQMDKLGLKARQTQTTVNGWLDSFAQKLKATQGDLTGFQQAFDVILQDTTSAIGQAITAWTSGQESLGDALKKSLAQEAATIAGKAAMWGAYFLAWGIADTFWNPARAGADFAAAAEFFAIAAIAGTFAYALRTPADTTGASTSTTTTTAATGVAQGPTQSVNSTHLAEGGVATSPTVATVGDSPSGGPAEEAIIPLESGSALSKIGMAIGKYVAPYLLSPERSAPLISLQVMSEVGTSIGHAEQSAEQARPESQFDMDEMGKAIAKHLPPPSVTIPVQGLISSDNLLSVVKKIDRLVKQNHVTLTASNSFKVTKRS